MAFYSKNLTTLTVSNKLNPVKIRVLLGGGYNLIYT